MMRELFPAPVRPTTPTFSPLRSSKSTPRSTGGAPGRYGITIPENLTSPRFGQVAGSPRSSGDGGSSMPSRSGATSEMSSARSMPPVPAWISPKVAVMTLKKRRIWNELLMARPAFAELTPGPSLRTARRVVARTRKTPTRSRRKASQSCSQICASDAAQLLSCIAMLPSWNRSCAPKARTTARPLSVSLVWATTSSAARPTAILIRVQAKQ
mmetsp:Transcript_60833/g.127483  ORF Transcript_60833/g.127483 Transcript_60833/m.127483 type:complete len:212 (+) Transcript_60833:727-1362(+)